ncbi:MAG: quinone oxidoreductase [Thermoanaerobaculia bacterium]
MKAVRVHAPGGPEAMVYEDIPEPTPAPGEALVRVEAAGVNFIDVYHRTGLYNVPMPVTLGQEAAGRVESVAPDVTEVAPGDRVAWAAVLGAYAEKAVVPARRLVKIPDGVSVRLAAAAMLQGMTAHYLACSTHPLKAGDTCLVHAAAGGVGQLLTQIAKMRGARVLGTVSTPAKAALAKAAGADAAIQYTKDDFEAEARRLTSGRGVEVVYDSVGRTTFEKSLGSLAPRGLLALFGQSSGPVPPLDPQVLAQRGSLYLTRPRINAYTATREELLWRATDILGWIRDGRLTVRIDRELPLSAAAEAHRALESRVTAGKVLLVT